MSLPIDWKKLAKKNKKQYSSFLNSNKSKSVISDLEDLHENVFREVNCLDCAACCKNISPRFKVPDIKRIAHHLSVKESILIDTYLKVDEDGDFVVQKSPCPFLNLDNTCKIYDVRPRDCRNYPYTDSDQFIKRPNTTLNNSTLCPAVFTLLEKLLKN